MPVFYDQSEIGGLVISGELDLAGIENCKKDRTTVCQVTSVKEYQSEFCSTLSPNSGRLHSHDLWFQEFIPFCLSAACGF